VTAVTTAAGFASFAMPGPGHSSTAPTDFAGDTLRDAAFTAVDAPVRDGACSKTSLAAHSTTPSGPHDAGATYRGARRSVKRTRARRATLNSSNDALRHGA